ncbi:MAG: hypothetical protein B7Y81_11140 [Caulobacter sp. 32-67-35]|nr:MAG: hypothetical protein B7Y81_11140 [Caulobacter sp. 32-67-35]
MDEDKKPRIDRRSLLLGAGLGVVGAGAVVAGGAAIKDAASGIVTPKAVGKGKAAKIGLSFKDSRPAHAEEPKAPAGAPNVVVIILDDVGFADLGCYGGELQTPAMDALAGKGLRYTNFRTTAMCSCTRAALLTGLNHHSAGMGWLADIDSGYPGYRGDLTRQNATLAEVLVEAGWSTFLLGKWHVNNADHGGPTGPFHNWPTSRGFERAYWYQGHSSDHFHPGALYEGTAPVEAGGEGYYLSDDLAQRAVTYLRTQQMMAPDKPFFMQLAFGAAHSPLQAKAADRDLYKGKFEAGWDEIRKQRLERQKALGLMPANTQLPPLSPGAKPWAELTADQKRLYARYMEVYGGMVTGVDRAIGTVMAELEVMGVRDNTLVVVFSDNGASAEGTEAGTPNVFGPAFGRPASEAEALALYDTMGEDGTFPPRRGACGSSSCTWSISIRPCWTPAGSSSPSSIAARRKSRWKARASPRPSPRPRPRRGPINTTSWAAIGPSRKATGGWWLSTSAASRSKTTTGASMIPPRIPTSCEMSRPIMPTS